MTNSCTFSLPILNWIDPLFDTFLSLGQLWSWIDDDPGVEEARAAAAVPGSSLRLSNNLEIGLNKGRDKKLTRIFTGIAASLTFHRVSYFHSGNEQLWCLKKRRGDSAIVSDRPTVGRIPSKWNCGLGAMGAWGN